MYEEISYYSALSLSVSSSLLALFPWLLFFFCHRRLVQSNDLCSSFNLTYEYQWKINSTVEITFAVAPCILLNCKIRWQQHQWDVSEFGEWNSLNVLCNRENWIRLKVNRHLRDNRYETCSLSCPFLFLLRGKVFFSPKNVHLPRFTSQLITPINFN